MTIPKPIVFVLSCAIVTLFVYICMRLVGLVVAGRMAARAARGVPSRPEPTFGNGYGGILAFGGMAASLVAIAGLAMLQPVAIAPGVGRQNDQKNQIHPGPAPKVKSSSVAQIAIGSTRGQVVQAEALDLRGVDSAIVNPPATSVASIRLKDIQQEIYWIQGSTLELEMYISRQLMEIGGLSDKIKQRAELAAQCQISRSAADAARAEGRNTDALELLESIANECQKNVSELVDPNLRNAKIVAEKVNEELVRDKSISAASSALLTSLVMEASVLKVLSSIAVEPKTRLAPLPAVPKAAKGLQQPNLR